METLQIEEDSFRKEIEEYFDGSKNLDELAEETKALISEFITGDQGGFGPWSHESQAMLDMHTLMDLFRDEDWVHIVVDKIASKISKQPLCVYKKIRSTNKIVIEPRPLHDIQYLLDNPNDYQDQSTFIYNIVVYYCMLGNAILNHQLVSKRLLILNAENISIRFDYKNAKIANYDLMAATDDSFTGLITRYSYDPRSIIHIRRPNPQSLVWGLSGFVPARRSVLFNRYSNEYLLNFYQKGGQPGVVINLDREANKEAVSRLMAMWIEKNQGRKNQRKPMILPKGASASMLDQKLADQDLKEYIKLNRETIINVYGVPKHELSIAESGSLGSEEYKIALRNFWEGPLTTIQNHIASSLTRCLKIFLGEDHFIAFDNSNVPILQENLTEKATTANLMLSTHTLNEVRSGMFNLQPIEGGDVVQGLQANQESYNPFGDYLLRGKQ